MWVPTSYKGVPDLRDGHALEDRDLEATAGQFRQERPGLGEASQSLGPRLGTNQLGFHSANPYRGQGQHRARRGRRAIDGAEDHGLALGTAPSPDLDPQGAPFVDGIAAARPRTRRPFGPTESDCGVAVSAAIDSDPLEDISAEISAAPGGVEKCPSSVYPPTVKPKTIVAAMVLEATLRMVS